MVPDDKPVVFIPLSRGHPVEALPALDHAFTRADSVLTFTHQEAASVARRTPRAADKITTIHLVCRVHESAHRNEPHAYEAGYHIAVVADWTVPRAFDVLFPWLGAVADDVGGVEFRPVGPGAGTLPFPHATLFAEGGLDMWRHIVRSAAVLDPAHHQLLGKTVLEALHYGVPVLVPTTGGATREHAELGNGGLWYRATQDLAAAIVRLRGDDTMRAELSDHGRAYAGRWYGDTQRFIDSVTHAVRAITG
jgi:hypothetical protein